MHISYFCTIFARQMHRKYYILFLLIVCVITACTPRVIRKAQSIVAQADSLRAKGCIYSDSAELAQAYETLGQWQWFYADEYAHACYHYGRILREKEHPVEAMQCFINATHSHTRDYAILGRVYSNMGDICHLASEFPLSYDMFERSAEMFLRNGDTLLYYYLLNDMAFELAEQGKKEETFVLLSKLNNGNVDVDVLSKTLETKARLYLKCEQYDSALYYAHMLLCKDNNNVAVTLLIAQSYSYLGYKDSATLYANKILSKTNELYELNNALYILTNDDESKDKQDIRLTAADRSDVQKLIEIRQGKLSQAVQLLEQDLNRKPDWRWFWGVVATLLVVGLCLWLYIFRKHKQRALLSQQIEDWAIQNKEAEDQQIKRYNDRLLRIQENCDILANSDSIMDSLQWKNYDKFCECINIHFFLLADKLKATDRLNEKEIRLCVLVLIGSFTDKQMANILYYSYNSIRSTKRTLANKLGTTSANLRSFLIEKAAK